MSPAKKKRFEEDLKEPRFYDDMYVVVDGYVLKFTDEDPDNDLPVYECTHEDCSAECFLKECGYVYFGIYNRHNHKPPPEVSVAATIEKRKRRQVKPEAASQEDTSSCIADKPSSSKDVECIEIDSEDEVETEPTPENQSDAAPEEDHIEKSMNPEPPKDKEIEEAIAVQQADADEPCEAKAGETDSKETEEGIDKSVEEAEPIHKGVDQEEAKQQEVNPKVSEPENKDSDGENCESDDDDDIRMSPGYTEFQPLNIEEDTLESICASCNKSDDLTPMIGCNHCDDWFHWSCIGMKTEPDQDSWYCSKCTDKQKKYLGVSDISMTESSEREPDVAPNEPPASSSENKSKGQEEKAPEVATESEAVKPQQDLPIAQVSVQPENPSEASDLPVLTTEMIQEHLKIAPEGDSRPQHSQVRQEILIQSSTAPNFSNLLQQVPSTSSGFINRQPTSSIGPNSPRVVLRNLTTNQVPNHVQRIWTYAGSYSPIKFGRPIINVPPGMTVTRVPPVAHGSGFLNISRVPTNRAAFPVPQNQRQYIPPAAHITQVRGSLGSGFLNISRVPTNPPAYSVPQNQRQYIPPAAHMNNGFALNQVRQPAIQVTSVQSNPRSPAPRTLMMHVNQTDYEIYKNLTDKLAALEADKKIYEIEKRKLTQEVKGLKELISARNLAATMTWGPGTSATGSSSDKQEYDKLKKEYDTLLTNHQQVINDRRRQTEGNKDLEKRIRAECKKEVDAEKKTLAKQKPDQVIRIKKNDGDNSVHWAEANTKVLVHHTGDKHSTIIHFQAKR